MKKPFRLLAVGLLALVIIANVGLASRSIFKTHFSPDDPTKTEPGAFSDLYPRWRGAREMIFHRENPYSEKITIGNQRAFYGNFDPNDGVLRDPMAFSYPATVAVPLLPLLPLPYRTAMTIFGYLSILALVWGCLKWSSWCCPSLGVEWRIAAVAAALAIQPAVSAVLLRQPTIIAFIGVTAFAACFRKGKYVAAGLALALSTVKPHMTVFVALGLHWLAIKNWKKYNKIIISFWVALISMVLFCCVFTPDWPVRWIESVERYKRLALGAVSLTDFWISNSYASFAIKSLIYLSVAAAWLRQKETESLDFYRTLSLSMAAPFMVFPAGHLYNHIFAYPLWFLSVDAALSSRKRIVKFTVSLSSATAFLFWAWSTLALFLKQFPALVAKLGLPQESFTEIYMGAWPWSLCLLAPPLLYLTEVVFPMAKSSREK